MDPRLRLRALGMLLAMAALGVGVYVLKPGVTPWLPKCPLYHLTGLYCPGCGTLRGLHQLLHGSLMGAWRCNPLMVVCLPLLGYAVATQVFTTITGRRVRDPAISPLASWLAVAVVVIYGIVRNIPAYPFSLLAPR